MYTICILEILCRKIHNSLISLICNKIVIIVSLLKLSITGESLNNELNNIMLPAYLNKCESKKAILDKLDKFLMEFDEFLTVS